MKLKYPRGAARSLKGIKQPLSRTGTIFLVLPLYSNAGPHKLSEDNFQDNYQVFDVNGNPYGRWYVTTSLAVVKCGQGRYIDTGFFFANYWHAYAHSLRLRNIFNVKQANRA